MTELSAAWRLLELISMKDDLDSTEAWAAIESADAGVDPGELTVCAIKHGLAPALGNFFATTDRHTLIPPYIRRHLYATLDQNIYRTRASVDEARRIVAEFDRRGVGVACTKGIVLQATIYGGRGTRRFGDVDLMVHHSDANVAAEVLTELGYTSGVTYSYATESLEPLPRATTVLYKLYPDHLPHFYRLTDREPFRYHMFDVAYSLTWYDSAWQVSMEEVMGSVERVPVRPGMTLPALNPAFGFLFVVLHLFREAWFVQALANRDVRLNQFADVLRQWQHLEPSEVERVRSIVKRYELEPAVTWVCHHVDSVFGTSLVAEHGGLASYADPAWLASAVGLDGTFQVWHGDMRRRLSTAGTPHLAPAPEPPYAAIARGARR